MKVSKKRVVLRYAIQRGDDRCKVLDPNQIHFLRALTDTSRRSGLIRPAALYSTKSSGISEMNNRRASIGFL